MLPSFLAPKSMAPKTAATKAAAAAKGKPCPKPVAKKAEARPEHRMRSKAPAAPKKAQAPPETASSSGPASLKAQQSGFITFLSKAQQGKQLERAESAKRVLEAYQECTDPVLKRQMVQDFYSAGGARGKGLEVACKQSIVTRDSNRAQAWSGWVTVRGLCKLWEALKEEKKKREEKQKKKKKNKKKNQKEEQRRRTTTRRRRGRRRRRKKENRRRSRRRKKKKKKKKTNNINKKKKRKKKKQEKRKKMMKMNQKK